MNFSSSSSSSSSSTALFIDSPYTSCFTDTFSVIAGVAIADICLYLLVCIPDYLAILKAVVGINFSLLLVSILQTDFPNQFPDPSSNPLTLIGIYATFFVVFFSVLAAMDEIAYLIFAVLLTGPILFGLSQTISQWFSDHLNFTISDLASAIICVILTFVVCLIYIIASHSSKLALLIKNILYAALGTIATHLLVIRWGDNDQFSDNTYCCATPAGMPTTTTCPVAFNTAYVLLFVFLLIIRLTLEILWKRFKEKHGICFCCTCCCKSKKDNEEEEDKDDNKLIKNYDTETSEEYEE
jgi:hypothetical protein